jgi:hypothetical protein
MEKLSLTKSIIPAVATSAVMAIFFLISKASGWPYMSGLHLINCLLLVPAIWYATNRIHRLRVNPYPYLRGLAGGLGAAALASFIFSFFLLLYLRFIDQPYMTEVKRYVPLGDYMTPMIVALVFFTEQVCAGFIMALIIMQIYKTKNN